jgi:hypothetical protein
MANRHGVHADFRPSQIGMERVSCGTGAIILGDLENPTRSKIKLWSLVLAHIRPGTGCHRRSGPPQTGGGSLKHFKDWDTLEDQNGCSDGN